MMRPRGSDLPVAAYAKAVAALDEFDATTAEYVALLDTQRALLAQGDSAAVARSIVRGDAMASRAAACGRRLAPFREALASDALNGPRADAVRRRLERMTHRAALLGSAAATVAARCEAERHAAGAALARLQAPAGGRGAAYASRPMVRGSLTLDTRG